MSEAVVTRQCISRLGWLDRCRVGLLYRDVKFQRKRKRDGVTAVSFRVPIKKTPLVLEEELAEGQSKFSRGAENVPRAWSSR